LVRFWKMAAAVPLALAFAGSAAADDKPIYAPPAAWVQPAELPSTAGADPSSSFQVLLDDDQVRLDPAGDAEYNRRAVKVLKPEALAGLNTLTETWDPATEQLILHHLRIIRDGKTIDLLGDGKAMLVLRREQNLEKAMLDGRMSATRQLDGLQVGDILDVAFTRIRHDPLVKGRSYDLEAERFPGLAAHYRVSVSWPQADPVKWRAQPGFPAPSVASHDGRTWLTLDLHDVRAPRPPTGAPLRYARVGTLEASSFADWQDVSRLMAAHYIQAARLKPDSPIKAEAAAIAARSKDPKVRAFLALQAVEQKVRYLALLMGEGGYVPAAADETWSRRFGDCKGKTVLLLALLSELGVQAEPALVSLGGGDGMNEREPSLAAFNHVIVRAVIDGQVYWLDGTRAGDQGGLASLRPPPHHWALPLTVEGAPLEAIAEPPLPEPTTETSLRIDASKGLDAPAPVKISFRYAGDLASAVRSSIGRAQKEDFIRAFKQRMAASMNWLQPESVDWRDDPDHDAFEIDLTGTATMDWRKNPDFGVREYRTDAPRVAIKPFPVREPGPAIDAPYAVTFPLFVLNRTEIVLPDQGKGFLVRGPNGVERVGGYEVTRASGLAGGVAFFQAQLRSDAREIPVAAAQAANARLRVLASDEGLVRAPS
jgi:transglutaminase-like putative cysteine protease